MGSQVSGRGMRTVAGVLVALVAVVLAAPSKANAGCARHVAVRPDPLDDLARLESLQGDVSTDDALTPHSIPSDLPKPCSGPSCSGRPAVPMPAPLVVHPDRSDRWGCLADALAVNGPECKLLPPPDHTERPRNTGTSIDRPPRLV